MRRTLIVDAGDDFDGGRSSFPPDRARDFYNDRCKLLGEPGHYVVLELVKAGKLDLIVVGGDRFAALTRDDAGVVNVSMLYLCRDLPAFVAGGDARKAIP